MENNDSNKACDKAHDPGKYSQAPIMLTSKTSENSEHNLMLSMFPKIFRYDNLFLC